MDAPPAAERATGWMCMSADRGPQPADTTPDATTEHCDIYGCWYRYSDTHVEFISNGAYYYYGDNIEGEAFIHGVWDLHYTLESEDANVRVTSEILDTEWSGALYNGAHNVVGSNLGNCGPVSGPTVAPANEEFSSPSTVCTKSDSKSYDHNMVIQISFEDPNDTQGGYYYMYVKSAVSHSATLPATQYYFDPVDDLPLNVFVLGYDA